ncbi:urease accessory protein UreE [Teredinibacter waterburyi]|uniref:urease accessory protein UreE n=1 Tax=Teredinibacter waterburyi TaxID=1500538 RepID=UPI00165FF335|nr:urease accessory protein UreE [Teredinibacter waterburyi]
MLEAYEILATTSDDYQELVATYDERKKSRHRTTTSTGADVGWFLERGRVLEDGEYLKCSDGTVIKIIAAMESVSEVVSAELLLLTRAAYHLGNRHVPLQIGVQIGKESDAGFLRYQHDHVLDDMVRGLGLTVAHADKPFNPENGAYHGSSHGHSHSHDGDHSHSH